MSQSRPSATTGDDHPRPGTGVFQVTFSVSLHSSGTTASAAWPCPVGPRNCGQSPARAGAPATAATTAHAAAHDASLRIMALSMVIACLPSPGIVTGRRRA